ncbi:MAG TPA: hypothetical protein VFF79_04245 [Conexibacter sp.]|jgi:hypothetical protein|nr:hypothetical protein [Conexibacter sp.]
MDNQTLLVRRLVAAGVVVLVIVLMVVLVKGCVDSRREAALKDFNRSVRTLVEQSRSGVSKPFFDALTGASGGKATQVQETINQLTSVADEELSRAQGLSPPDAVKQAQSDLELVLSLRRDGVAKVADLIQTAMGGTAGAGTAVNQIAGQMQAFNASDVIYSQRVAPLILKGLKGDGIAASYDGTAGEQVLPYADFLPAGSGISWLGPDFVASQLGSTTAGGRSRGTPAPGLHGHALDSVSVGGTTLTSSGSNRIPASPPPTFTVNFTNGGTNNETNVRVTVEITGPNGTPIRAQTIVPNTTAGQQATADVQLRQSPSTSGPSTIRVTIEAVPGEKSLANNTASYTALFV